MVWVLFGPMTPFIAEQMSISATQKGLLTAVPLLGGSFFRPVLGLLADRIGGRRAGLIGLSLTLVPLILGWHFATHLWQLYIVGFLLGIAGASFAVALPLAGQALLSPRCWVREWRNIMAGMRYSVSHYFRSPPFCLSFFCLLATALENRRP